jgi:hypothetical protein
MAEQTLAQRIRARYPGTYDALSDVDLEAKVRAKYPGVYDQVPSTTPTLDEPPVAPDSSALTLLKEHPYQYAGETAANIPSSAGHQAVGLLDMGQTLARATGEVGQSIGGRLRELAGLNPYYPQGTPNLEALGQVPGAIWDRVTGYLDPETVARRVHDDPVGVGLDVYGAGEGALSAARAAGPTVSRAVRTAAPYAKRAAPYVAGGTAAALSGAGPVGILSGALGGKGLGKLIDVAGDYLGRKPPAAPPAGGAAPGAAPAAAADPAAALAAFEADLRARQAIKDDVARQSVLNKAKAKADADALYGKPKPAPAPPVPDAAAAMRAMTEEILAQQQARPAGAPGAAAGPGPQPPPRPPAAPGGAPGPSGGPSQPQPVPSHGQPPSQAARAPEPSAPRTVRDIAQANIDYLTTDVNPIRGPNPRANLRAAQPGSIESAPGIAARLHAAVQQLNLTGNAKRTLQSSIAAGPNQPRAVMSLIRYLERLDNLPPDVRSLIDDYNQFVNIDVHSQAAGRPRP